MRRTMWSCAASALVLGTMAGVAAAAWGEDRASTRSGTGAAQPVANIEQRADDPSVHVATLDNGITLLIQPIPGATMVAIEEVHRVGLIHDPAGVAQGSHLIEHLRCMGGTDSHAPGASYARLNTAGMANAETMGDLTHYDLVIPPEQLDEALAVILERHESLAIDDAIIAQEAPRCHAEVANVTRAMGGPGLKFAMAAAVQAWRHGLDHASLLTGLEAWDAASAEQWMRATHQPERLTLALVGAVDPDEITRRAEERFGALAALDAPNEADPFVAIDYASHPAEQAVTWDVDAAAVFVAYPPPADAEEQAALTLWSLLAMQQLVADLTTRHAGDATFRPRPGDGIMNGTAYPVGDLPLYTFSSAPASPAERRALAGFIASRLEEIAAAPTRTAAQARGYARTYARATEAGLDRLAFDRSVASLTRDGNKRHAEMMVLGNTALQTALAWHSFGPDPVARLNAIADRPPEWWADVIQRTVNPANRRITILAPAREGEAGDGRDAEHGAEGHDVGTPDAATPTRPR
ncbi:MAG: insulinase family protein [Phycisphaerales bacterium]